MLRRALRLKLPDMLAVLSLESDSRPTRLRSIRTSLTTTKDEDTWTLQAPFDMGDNEMGLCDTLRQPETDGAFVLVGQIDP